MSAIIRYPMSVSVIFFHASQLGYTHPTTGLLLWAVSKGEMSKQRHRALKTCGVHFQPIGICFAGFRRCINQVSPLFCYGYIYGYIHVPTTVYQPMVPPFRSNSILDSACPRGVPSSQLRDTRLSIFMLGYPQGGLTSFPY